MGKYQLIYFPVRGRGEAIRLLFVENDIEFEEVNCAPFSRFLEEFKPKMAFGQVPCLKDGELDLVQSNAILRHLGRQNGLYGSSNEDAVRIDIINDAVEDLRSAYTSMIYKNYEAGKDEFIASLPTQLQYFENFLSKWGDGKSGFSVGQKRSFADYNLFDLLDSLRTLCPPCLDKYPTLTSFFQANLAKPKIAAYRETEPFKTRPINGNNKQ